MIWGILGVAGGAFLGGIARWALAKLPGRFVGTFAANMIGALVLGIAVTGPGMVPLAAGTGLAGGLSTWSTLARELGGLVGAKQWRVLGRYLAATVLIGVIMAHRGTVWGARIWANIGF